ncbi:MAG TPA: shikimate kinase [Acidimicrobiales bacterium]
MSPGSPDGPPTLATAPRHLVLVGMMGAGKTTVGSRLARLLDRPFVDSDVEVERRSARSVRQIFADDGEAAFRALESEVLAEALGSEEPSVIAAAGGTVLDELNRRRMRQCGVVVFLDARPAALATRVGGDDHRPLLGDDPAAALVRLDELRRPLYLEASHHVVDVSAPTGPDAVVQRVLALVTS